MLQSQKQALRLRRAIIANLGILSNAFLSFLSTYLGFFVLEASSVLMLALSFWLGHLVIVLCIAFNINLRFKDASMTILQMSWCIISLSVLMFFMQEIRHLVLMGYLLIMSFGAFRLSLKEFYGITIFTILSYLACLYSIYIYRPLEIQPSQELFVFCGFVFVLCGFAFISMEFSNLRNTLGLRHRELKTAFSRIEELAITDELTGLYNRRHLMKILSQQRALANRSRYGFVVCYLDLDHFKKVNDLYGHPFGDKVLKAFSRLIDASLREVDIGARIGGEEFVLILANTRLDAAYRVCQRISDQWLSHSFEESCDLSFTISTGITEFKPPEAIEQTLERADALLYDAKNNGRNCIMMESQELQVPFDFEKNNELEHF